MAYLMATLIVIAILSAAINIALRGAVTALLHQVGRFEEFGSPRDFYMSDYLPWETLHLRNLSKGDRLLVRAYFASWITMLVAFSAVVVGAFVVFVVWG